VKRLMLAFAAITLFVTTAALPCLADGNPEPICDKNGCQKPPLPQVASSTSWQNLFNWVTFNTLASQCTVDAGGNIWTCGFTSPSGAQLLLVEDSSQTCAANGICSYSSYTVPTGPGYTQYFTLGSSTGISLGSTVNIGCYPIMLSQ
jgi:hypothetical protein